jgi:hypothetical protein
MQQSTTTSRIGALLVITVAITIFDSYIPHDQTMFRGILSLVQLGFMAATMAVAVRALVRSF